MSVVRAIHNERKQEIEFLVGEVVFYVDGKAYYFSDPRQAALTVAAISVSPKCLTFGEILKILIKEGRIGIIGEFVDKQYLKKKIFSINKAIFDAKNIAVCR